MHRSIYLSLLQLVMCTHCYILHPSDSRNLSFQRMGGDPLSNQDWPVVEQDNGFVEGMSDNRMERHVDAIFTNTYRKFLGQISARRYLQNMMGKRLGHDTHNGQEEHQADSVLSERTLRDAFLSALRDRPDWRIEQPLHPYQ